MNIDVPRERIEEFCRKWKIAEFALSGSVLRHDFRPDSDVDVLVTFDANARWSLFDQVDMIEELKEMFGRDVDLTEKRGIINPYIRRHVMAHHQIVYSADTSAVETR